MDSISNKHQLLAALLLVIGLFVWYFDGIIDKPPVGHHCWASSDRLSLAMNYYDNGLNFFKPATHAQYSKEGIVGVEFPIQSYLAAMIAKPFGRHSISMIFRGLTLLYSLLAMWYLLKLASFFTQNNIWAIFLTILFVTNPIWAYFSSSYLPDTVSFSFFIMALFYFFRFRRNEEPKDAYKTLWLISIAVLVKMSMGLYWLILVGFIWFTLLFQRNKNNNADIWKYTFACFLCGMSIIAWFVYIKYLNHHYQSNYIFLAEAKPLWSIGGFQEIKAFLITVIERNGRLFFNVFQYPFLIINAIVLGGFGLFYFRKKRDVLLLFISFFFAALIGFVLMGKQFDFHDYYAIVIVFPFITIFYLFGIKLIAHWSDQQNQKIRYSIYLFLSIWSIFMIVECKSRIFTFHKEPHEPPGEWVVNKVRDASALDIPKDAHVLLIAGSAPNLGLIVFDRKGITKKMDPSKDQIDDYIHFMNTHVLDYMILDTKKYKTLVEFNPCLSHQFELIQETHMFCVLKPKGSRKQLQWQNKENTKAKQIYFNNFEPIDSCSTKNTLGKNSSSGFKSDQDHKYIFPFEGRAQKITSLEKGKVVYSAWVKIEKRTEVAFVISVKNKWGKKTFQKRNTIIEGNPNWQKVTGELDFEFTNFHFDQLSTYLWNFKGKEMFVDELEITFLPSD